MKFSYDDAELPFRRKRISAERKTVRLYDEIMKLRNKGVGMYIIVIYKNDGVTKMDLGLIKTYDSKKDMHIIDFDGDIQRLYLLNWKIRDLSGLKETIVKTIRFFNYYIKNLFDQKNNDFSWLKNKKTIEKYKIKLLQELKLPVKIYKFREDLEMIKNEDNKLTNKIFSMMSIYDLLNEDFSIFDKEELVNIKPNKYKKKTVPEYEYNHQILNACKLLKKRYTREEKITFLSENDDYFKSHYFDILIDTAKRDTLKSDFSGRKLVRAIKKDHELKDFIKLSDDEMFDMWCK
jgi:hypothetical protein